MKFGHDPISNWYHEKASSYTIDHVSRAELGAKTLVVILLLYGCMIVLIVHAIIIIVIKPHTTVSTPQVIIEWTLRDWLSNFCYFFSFIIGSYGPNYKMQHQLQS